MRRNKILILSLLSMFVFSCSNTNNSSASSNVENSSSESSSSSSKVESSTTSSSSSIKVEVESVELKINKNKLKVGETTTFEINILPNNATDKSYNVVSLNEDVLSVNNNEITALKAGKGQIKVVSNNKEDIKEIEVYEDNQNDIINLLNTNINNEKNNLSTINVSSFNIGSYDTTYQEIEARYYKSSVNQITKNYNVENNEKKDVISTEYKFIGNYNDKDYVITKTLPEAGYNDGIETELGNNDSKELYYDGNTGVIGIINSIYKLTNSTDYLLLNKANISKEIINQNVVYNVSYEEEITSSWGLTKLYSVQNMVLSFNNEKLINAHYTKTLYKDYLVDNKVDLTKATIDTKKEYKYDLTWNGRFEDKDMLVNPSDYFLTSFDVKIYNDEALTNETTTFYVGEKIYYKIFDVAPSMAFVDIQIDVEGTGVYKDTDYLGNVTIKCTTTGKATITFSSNGIEKKINVVVQTPKPEKIEFDPEDEWTKHEVKVGKTIDLSSRFTVTPSNASKEVTFSIVSGYLYASLEVDLYGRNIILRGLNAGVARIRVTSNVDKNIFDECDFRVVEE
jgi:hypothetical protein